jgi:uncharacterized Zn-binding protein involved in type VI secretion
MRKLMLGAAAAACAALGGCATIGSSGGITISDVETDAKAICSFDPTAAAIANVLSAAPGVAVAEDVAQIICAAVTTAAAPAQSARLGASQTVTRTITVNGKPVTITGSFGASLPANAPVSKRILVNGKPVTIQGRFVGQ